MKSSTHRAALHKSTQTSSFFLLHQSLWISKLAFQLGLVFFSEDTAERAVCLHTWCLLWNVQDLNLRVEALSAELFWPHSTFSAIVSEDSSAPVTRDTCWGNSLLGLHIPTAAIGNITELLHATSEHCWGKETTSRPSPQYFWKKFPLQWEKGEKNKWQKRVKKNLSSFGTF